MITRLTVFFEPLDVLQFRDHRPFDMGEHAVANTVFPGPATFRGALRTLLFQGLGACFDRRDADADADEHFGIQPAWAREWLGGRSTPGRIAVRGPLLARLSAGETAVEPFFHAPRDLVSDDAVDPQTGETRTVHRSVLGRSARDLEHRHGLVRIRWDGSEARRTSGPLPWVRADPEKGGTPGYLTLAGAKAYLAAGPEGLDLRSRGQPALAIPESDLLQREPRVGIARDPGSLTAEDRMFYLTAPFRAAAGVGFAVDVEVPSGTEAAVHLRALNGVITPLGGKAHRARVHVFDKPLVPPDLAPETAQGPCRLWLQTAARFPLDLSGALVLADRPVPVGGFDFARGAPRPLRPALGPGTVIHLLEGAQWPLSADDTRDGYGFALSGPIPQPASISEGKS